MADVKSHNPEKTESSPQASPTPQDYYAVLTKVINDVSRDPSQLRKLVYALAWQNLKPEVIVTKPIPEAKTQAKSIYELEHAVQLERAIERIEVEAIEQERKAPIRPRVDARAAPTPPPPAAARSLRQPADAFDPASLAEQTSAPAAPAPVIPTPGVVLTPGVVPEPAAPAAEDLDAPRAASTRPAEREPEIAALHAPLAPPRASGAAAVPAAPQPERKDAIPSWLGQTDRATPGSMGYGSALPSHERRTKVFPFLKLIAASVVGILVFIGISGWMYLGRHPGAASTTAVAPQQQAQAPTPAADEAPPTPGQVQLAAGQPASESPPGLPFPLPRNPGVYAGVPGQLFELEQLPIKVPDARVQVSAEITKPSSVNIPGDNLSFVVFRRDLTTSVPQTVAVRVIARVQRTTKIVDGKPAIVPVEGVWRIRAKAYEFKVSPLEGRNEMVVIQPNPGFVFQPGRYAVVLNGFGYDFTVAGEVTAPEQCLEQVEVANGAMLSECPKT